MLANAGIAFVVVPTPPTNCPKVVAGVAASPYVVTPRPSIFAWLKMLKPSTRSSRARRSVSLIRFST